MLFGLLLPVVPGGAESLCVLVYIVSALAMAVPVFRFQFWWVYISFLVLEAMVGMFNSCGATLRSKYYPDSLQSTIMTVFRLPLNLLVCVGTLLTNRAGTSVGALQTVLIVLAGMHIVAAALQVALSGLVVSTSTSSTSISATTATSISASNVIDAEPDTVVVTLKRSPAKRKSTSSSTTTVTTTVVVSTTTNSSSKSSKVVSGKAATAKTSKTTSTATKAAPERPRSSSRSRSSNNTPARVTRSRAATPSKRK